MKRIEQQQGNVSLLMVIIFITIGTLLIKSVHFFQERARDERRNEIKYFDAFNKAESALAWGGTLHWDSKHRELRHWVCQKEETQQWKSCLKHYKGATFVLSGQSHYRSENEIKVYRWMVLDVNKRQFFPREKGWLDYCPVIKKGFCE
ncbi:DUF2509 family protein [Providencia rettgeri]|uniref:DUF2509 family protein n=1 Tax=Providencia rettgeri TaxID=587 RepID=UPI000D6F89EC